jgi:hypothetical protein
LIPYLLDHVARIAHGDSRARKAQHLRGHKYGRQPPMPAQHWFSLAIDKPRYDRQDCQPLFSHSFECDNLAQRTTFDAYYHRTCLDVVLGIPNGEHVIGLDPQSLEQPRHPVPLGGTRGQHLAPPRPSILYSYGKGKGTCHRIVILIIVILIIIITTTTTTTITITIAIIAHSSPPAYPPVPA